MDKLESNPIPSDIDLRGWQLHVTGAVSQALQLTQDDLRSLPDKNFSDDFTCVEGWRARDLSWHGIHVEAVLSQASPATDAGYVLVHAMDGDYASSFPIERVREALLAFELDGEPLTVEHGGPVRLVPTDGDADCWESIKWVSQIEVTKENPTEHDTAKGIALDRVSEPTE